MDKAKIYAPKIIVIYEPIIIYRRLIFAGKFRYIMNIHHFGIPWDTAKGTVKHEKNKSAVL